MIRQRIKAGLKRAVAQGVKLGRPKIDGATERKVRRQLAKGIGILKVARTLGIGTGTVQASRAVGVELLIVGASNEHDFGRAFETLVQRRAGALAISSDVFFNTQNKAEVVREQWEEWLKLLTKVERWPHPYDPMWCVAIVWQSPDHYRAMFGDWHKIVAEVTAGEAPYGVNFITIARGRASASYLSQAMRPTMSVASAVIT